MKVRKRLKLRLMKVGTTSLFNSVSGVHMAATILQMPETFVVGMRVAFKDGYDAAILGWGDFRNINKPQLGALKKNGILGKFKVFESRLHNLDDVVIGQKVSINHFVAGQYIDATGQTIGKGFAGAMKRHGFAGLRASHGVSIAHRSHGSTGQCQDPGRVWKGKKMAGRMGNEQVTIQNLKVLGVDEKRNLLIVAGNSIPGNAGSYVVISDAIKKSLPSNVSYPSVFVADNGLGVVDENC